MKEKMSTFTAMDVLGCNLYWINLNAKNIKEHLKGRGCGGCVNDD